MQASTCSIRDMQASTCSIMNNEQKLCIVDRVKIGPNWISFDGDVWQLVLPTMRRFSAHLGEYGIKLERSNTVEYSAPKSYDYKITDYTFEIRIQMTKASKTYSIKRFLGNYLTDLLGIHVAQRIKKTQITDLFVTSGNLYWHFENVVYFTPLGESPAKQFIAEICNPHLPINNAIKYDKPLSLYFVICKNIHLCIDMLGEELIYSKPIRYRTRHTGDLIQCLYANDIRGFQPSWLGNNFPVMGDGDKQLLECGELCKQSVDSVIRIIHNAYQNGETPRSILECDGVYYKLPIILEMFLKDELPTGKLAAWAGNKFHETTFAFHYNQGINVQFSKADGQKKILRFEPKRTALSAKIIQICLTIYTGTKHNPLCQKQLPRSNYD